MGGSLKYSLRMLFTFLYGANWGHAVRFQAPSLIALISH